MARCSESLQNGCRFMFSLALLEEPTVDKSAVRLCSSSFWSCSFFSCCEVCYVAFRKLERGTYVRRNVGRKFATQDISDAKWVPCVFNLRQMDYARRDVCSVARIHREKMNGAFGLVNDNDHRTEPEQQDRRSLCLLPILLCWLEASKIQIGDRNSALMGSSFEEHSIRALRIAPEAMEISEPSKRAHHPLCKWVCAFQNTKWERLDLSTFFSAGQCARSLLIECVSSEMTNEIRHIESIHECLKCLLPTITLLSIGRNLRRRAKVREASTTFWRAAPRGIWFKTRQMNLLPEIHGL